MYVCIYTYQSYAGRSTSLHIFEGRSASVHLRIASTIKKPERKPEQALWVCEKDGSKEGCNDSFLDFYNYLYREIPGTAPKYDFFSPSEKKSGTHFVNKQDLICDCLYIAISFLSWSK